MNNPPRKAWPTKEKRFDWFRLYNDFVGHPKFRVAAKACSASVCEASMVALALLRAANRSRPRGWVRDFNTLETAALLDIEPETVAAIYQQFEELGWISNDYVSTWDERQPDREDPTAADRQQRRRDRLKQQRTALLGESAPPGKAPAADVASSNAVAGAQNWLLTEAPKAVAKSLGCTELAAIPVLTRWTNDIRKDQVTLAAILQAVLLLHLKGDKFRAQVNQRINSHVAGPRLPLGPALVQSGTG